MDYKEAYAKSLRLLNVRFLSEGELRRKLERHDADGEVIDAVIAKLKEERFVDDERLARAVYKQYAQKGRYGHLYIVNCLRRRDLPFPTSWSGPTRTKRRGGWWPSASKAEGTRGKSPVFFNTAAFHPR